MGEGGRREGWDLGGDSDLGGGRGGSGGWWRGGSGGRWGLGGGDCDVEGRGEGDLGVGIWVVETVMWRVVERGSGGWGSLPILPSKESSGREWRGNWYCRGTRTL